MTLTPLDYFLKWHNETPDNVFLRQPKNNQWHIFTYRDAGNEVKRVAEGIRKLGLPPKSHIAILSKNCAHWLMADLAIMLSGHVSVPIYPTLSASGVKEILVHSGAAVIFIGKLDSYSEQKSGIPAHIKKICFSFYGTEDGLRWEDFVRENEPENVTQLPKAEDLATIMYSSGTTGTPKGVMLTFGSFTYAAQKVIEGLQIKKPEKFFSYLPLSHIAERSLMQMVSITSGSTISFAESLDKFAENLREEKPTIFGGVPRIYLKFQEGILNKMPQKKLDRLLSIPIVSSIIKSAIQKKLGLHKARIIVSGAAPTPSSLIEWFGKLGIIIRETYGMTENTAYSHSNYKEIKLGTVGQPFPGVETKIGDEGEILIRHKALMTGYFNDAETTAKVFTSDGFLKTGDIGQIDEEGFLTITGRIKDQFKTDKAKFIAPAPIELKLLANRNLEQVCVVGTSIPQPIALVTLSASAKTKSKEEIVSSLSKIREEVNGSLESFEEIESLIVLKNDWTIENGLLTPSMKVKRNELEKLYLPKYKQWYSQKSAVIFE
jgi:long-chain acyl-CoA synthetase